MEMRLGGSKRLLLSPGHFESEPQLRSKLRASAQRAYGDRNQGLYTFIFCPLGTEESDIWHSGFEAGRSYPKAERRW